MTALGGIVSTNWSMNTLTVCMLAQSCVAKELEGMEGWRALCPLAWMCRRRALRNFRTAAANADNFHISTRTVEMVSIVAMHFKRGIPSWIVLKQYTLTFGVY